MGEKVPCEVHSVLIVDDEAGIRELLSEALADEGYAVKTAANGRQALAVLQEFRPCLILLDLMMPELDGSGFCREQQKVPHWADIPVALMSAAHNLRAYQAPCEPVAVFPKPFDVCNLVTQVERIAS